MLCVALLLMAAWDHSDWASILTRHVTPDSRVDYVGLKQTSLPVLERYLQQIAAPWPAAFTPDERKAALINAYNALVIRWVVSHYPVESIWRTKKPFSAARHRVDGNHLSLDDIEAELRKTGDPRIHAALVCAAASCPPLRREPYHATHVDEQLDDNSRRWLAMSHLNEFVPENGMARVSKVFDWYSKDFKPSVQAFLAAHAPESARSLFAGRRSVRIEFKPYHWGLNDTSKLGATYSARKFYWDWLRNR